MPTPQPQRQPPAPSSHLPGTQTPGARTPGSYPPSDLPPSNYTPNNQPPTKPNPMRGLSEYAVADTPATANSEYYANAADYWEARPVVVSREQSQQHATPQVQDRDQEGLSSPKKVTGADERDDGGVASGEEREGSREGRAGTHIAEEGAVQQGEGQEQKQDRDLPTTTQAQDIPSVPRPIDNSSLPQQQEQPTRTANSTEKHSASPFTSSPFNRSSPFRGSPFRASASPNSHGPNGGQMGGRRRRESTMIADGIDITTSTTENNSHNATDPAAMEAMGARGRRESIMGARNALV
ncbi:hypothetical protein B0J18DRAFT_441873 [Chaetomium sp. MPI-SDFR-AT-0129]|nr:hypothetical protein B0J18DRAFT_441873 [Chaetomium sp. MPI-SDFR-AT-0129]